MRTKICLAVVIACLAAASEAPAQTCNVEKLNAHSEGEGVSADFSSVDTSACALGIETTVHVDGTVGVLTIEDQCGSPPDQITTETILPTNDVAVVVSVYDRCLATQVLSLTATGEAEELHLSNNFKTASLRAAFEGVDDSRQTVSIAIDLVWNGVGQKEHKAEHLIDNQGGVKFHYGAAGTIRDAVAAGSVVIDGTDLTPLPSAEGTIERDAARELTVYR